jgi:hypothetical protein
LKGAPNTYTLQMATSERPANAATMYGDASRRGINLEELARSRGTFCELRLPDCAAVAVEYCTACRQLLCGPCAALAHVAAPPDAGHTRVMYGHITDTLVAGAKQAAALRTDCDSPAGGDARRGDHHRGAPEPEPAPAPASVPVPVPSSAALWRGTSVMFLSRILGRSM